MEFIFITGSDIHISDTGPRSRTDDFKATMLNKISQMRAACSKLKADAALLAGDLYNLKDPAKNSHRLNQDLIREFKKFPCPIYVIEGNHDLTANNLGSLEKQPLGVLFEDGTLIQLREQNITKNGHTISLVGIPYSENPDLKRVPPKADNIAVQICVMHVYAGLKAGKLYNERLYGYDELALLSPDIFILGHYHVDQGIYEHLGKHFVNIGSMSRGTLSEEDIQHQPQLGFIKISIDDNGNVTRTLKSIPLKVRPAAEVFDLQKKKEEEKEHKEIQEFVEKLAAEVVGSSITTARNIEDVIDKMSIAKTVKDRTLNFIRQAAASK